MDMPNSSQWIGSAPDHDMYDTHKQIEKHDTLIDWGEMQVRHSGNFMESYPLFTRYMGGINYQIEHHLFPNICHVHYRALSKIVKKTAEEFNMPYHSKLSFIGALRLHGRFLKSLGRA